MPGQRARTAQNITQTKEHRLAPPLTHLGRRIMSLNTNPIDNNPVPNSPPLHWTDRFRRRRIFHPADLLPGPATLRRLGNPRHVLRSMDAIYTRTRRFSRSLLRRRPTKGAAFKTLWWLFDTVLLFGMGSAYISRFEDFALLSRGENFGEWIREWRDEQQEEWNRLSTTLAILATMHAAILAIGPSPPSLALSLWIGGASLSVSGLFIVQYFPIKAFVIKDVDMGLLVGAEENDLVNSTLLIVTVSSPVAILMWSSIMFIVGMADFIIEGELMDTKSKLIAGIPVGVGVLLMLVTVSLGEIIDKKLKKKNKDV